MPIEFHFQKNIIFKGRKKLKSFIPTIFELNNTVAGNISFVFCSDDYLLEINKEFLNHDYFTDIITFDLTPKKQKEVDAEIYISVDRVKENAKSNSVPTELELNRVIFHGILHLCGYGDKTSSQKSVMTLKEDHFLSLFSRGTL
ncbi:MAG: rRNA maturation RNase YbeY [Ferruginibacter sp.]